MLLEETFSKNAFTWKEMCRCCIEKKHLLHSESRKEVQQRYGRSANFIILDAHVLQKNAEPNYVSPATAIKWFRNPKFFDFKGTSEDSFSALWTPIFARYSLLVGFKFLFGCTSFASFCTERSQSSLRNLATLFQLSLTDTFYWISSHMLRYCVNFIHTNH